MPQAKLSASLFSDATVVDHHCHGVVERTLDRPEFESMISESNWAPYAGRTNFDSQLGVAVRRWCAPVLGLEAFSDPQEYLERRAEIPPRQVNELLLRASGIDTYMVETGHRGDDILSPAQMAARGDATAESIVRLERIAELLIQERPEARDYGDAFRLALKEALEGAVGVKSIAAYRIGLDFDPSRPTEAEVKAAASCWLSRIERENGSIRLDDPVLIRFGLWCAVDEAQPIQFHVGFGDPDVDLHRCNPLLLTQWLRETRESGARALLLHCYPFQREAGYLAHVFPHVYCDVGLAVNYVGARAPQIIAESLELTPFDRALFSSDAWGLPELYLAGVKMFERGLLSVVNSWIDAEEWSASDAERLIHNVAHRNATRAYALKENL